MLWKVERDLMTKQIEASALLDFGENFVPIAQADLDVDIAYEREQQEAMVRVGEGRFFNDHWLR